MAKKIGKKYPPRKIYRVSHIQKTQLLKEKRVHKFFFISYFVKFTKIIKVVLRGFSTQMAQKMLKFIISFCSQLLTILLNLYLDRTKGGEFY